MTTRAKSRKTEEAAKRYDDFIFFLLCGLLLVLPLTIFPYTADIFELPKVTFLRIWVLLVAFSWALKIYRTGKITFRSTSLDVPVFFFGLVAVVATLFSINPLVSVVGGYYRYEGVFTILAYIAVFFVVTQFLQPKRMEALLSVLLASVALNALYGIFQHYGYDFIKLSGKVFALSRSSGALGNPVFLGALLVTTVSLPLAKSWQEKSLLSRIVFVLIILLLSVSLVFTSTRAAWLGLGAVLIMLILLMPQRLALGRILIVGLVVLGVTSSIFVFSRVYSPGQEATFAQRVLSIFQPRGSAATRLDMWRGSLFLIRDRPLLGSGWENFEGTFPLYGTKFLMSQEELPDRPHNQLLYVATSAGVLGLLAYLWLVLAPFLLGIRNFVYKGVSQGKRIWLAAILAGLAGYIVQDQFSISSAGVTPIFWLFLGMVARGFADEDRVWSKPLQIPIRSAILLVVGFMLLMGSTINLRFLWADVLFRRGLQSQSGSERNTSLERSVELNPYTNKYRSILAQAYTEEAFRNQNSQILQQAILVSEEGLRIDPRDEQLWVQLGDLYVVQGNGEGMEMAERAYKRVLDLHPLSAGAFWALGDLYLAQGKYERAVANLEKASSLVPRHTGVLLSLAETYERLGSSEESIEIYRRILMIDPENQKAKAVLGSKRRN